MNWSLIFTAIKWLLGLFGRGKGTHITFEARPEASVQQEKEKLAELTQKLKEKKDELDKATLQDCRARRQRLRSYANTILAPKCRKLRAEYDSLKQEYLTAGGLPLDGW